MKKVFVYLFLAFFLSISFQRASAQSVAINTDGSVADTSAILDVKSSVKGILIPRMSSAQRLAIYAPARGLLVYDTTTNSFWFNNGSIWRIVSDSATSWSLTGNSGTDPN